ncbi:MAG: hypothetical protein AAGK37_17820 [Pseudomonadota bacterium]
MIRFLISVSVLLFSLPAFASSPALTKSALCDLIAAIDLPALDSALDQLELDAALGHVSFDHQREVYEAFKVTHPDMDGFIKEWRQAHPNSGHALLARAIHDRSIAFIVLGVKRGDLTYPEALPEFSDLSRSAVKAAVLAYELMPDHVLAADLMLSFATTRHAPEEASHYLERVMTTRPNHGSLAVALYATNPGWGRSWQKAKQMCRDWAPRVPDMDGYSREICLVEAAFSASPQYGQESTVVRHTMAWSNHPRVAHGRPYDLLTSGKRDNETARAALAVIEADTD